MPNFEALQLPSPKNWQDFERLCRDLWSRIWNDPAAQLHGRVGQSQQGVDIFGKPGQKDEWEGVQCKLGESLTLEEIEEEIEKAKAFVPKLSRLTLATTGRRDAKIQQEVRKLSDLQEAKGSFPVSIDSWDDIEQKLSAYPDLIQKYFPQIFPSGKPARLFPPGLRNLLEALRGKQVAGPLIACLSLLTTASVGTWFALPEAGLPIFRRPAIAVLPLEDLSPGRLGVRAFPDSRSLSGMLTDVLDSQTRIRVIPFAESSLVAGHLPRSRSDCLREESLRQARKFIGADYIVGGSFERFPENAGLRLNLCLQRTSEGGRWVPFSHSFQGKGPLKAFVGDRARELLHEVGAFIVSRPGQARYSDSDVAVGMYFEGVEQLERYEVREAATSFCRAKEIDPGFLLSRLALSRAWKELGYDRRAEREAFQIRDLFLANRPADSDREAALIDAYYHTTRQDWKEAIESYREIWSRYTDYPDYALELIEVQNLAGRTKDAQASIATLRELETRGETFLSERNRVQLGIQEAIASMLDDPQRELQIAQGAAEAASQLQDPALEARARFLECDALRQLGRAFEDTCATAISRFRSIHDRSNEAKAYQVQGHQAMDQRDFRGALRLYGDALRIFRDIGFQRGRADALANISYALSEAGGEQQARDTCERALAIATEIRSVNWPEIANDCAYFHAMTGDFARANELYRQVLAAARAKGSRVTEAAVLGNIAYMLHGERKLGEAREKYLQSIRLSREIGDTGTDFDETLVHYARLLFDTGELSQARATLQDVLERLPEEQRADLSTEFLCSMGRVLGPGERSWESLAAELAAFTPGLCTQSPPLPMDPVPSDPPAEMAADC